MDAESPDRRSPEAVELPQAPADAALPEAEATGNPEVDAALDRLRELGEQPTSAHPGLYDEVHRALQDALGRIGQPAAQ